MRAVVEIVLLVRQGRELARSDKRVPLVYFDSCEPMVLLPVNGPE